jgi:Uma2 family endonuclease
MGTLQTVPVTFEEFMRLPNPKSGHLELHHGEVISVPPRQHSHARLQQMISELLLPMTKGKGLIMTEFPFRVEGQEAWQADLGFVAAERADIPDPYLRGAPDLVIEVLSPSNTVDEINEKMDICMANGCTCFWVVDPKRKTVSVTEGDTARQYREGTSIPLPAPLEGEIAVASVFL